MPNRILRDWTDSMRIDGVGFQSEVLFTRLIMKVDDYGRFSAHPKLIKSLCFPLKDGVRDADITRWLAECEKAGLIVVYTVKGRSYLQIEDFRQRERAEKSKFPDPSEKDDIGPSSDRQVTVECQSPAAVFVDEGVDEGVGATCSPSVERKLSDFDKFYAAYPRKIGRDKAQKAWNTHSKLRPSIADILEAVEAAKSCGQWTKDGGQFIPHPTTWINRGGWNDRHETIDPKNWEKDWQ